MDCLRCNQPIVANELTLTHASEAECISVCVKRIDELDKKIYAQHEGLRKALEQLDAFHVAQGQIIAEHEHEQLTRTARDAAIFRAEVLRLRTELARREAQR